MLKILISSILFFLLIPLKAKPPILENEDLSTPPPKIIRTCCSFGYELKMWGLPFIEKTAIGALDMLGTHQYLGGKIEGNGIIYTKRAGFLDIGHLRDYSDWVAYLYKLIYTHIKTGKHKIIDLGYEGGSKTLVLYLPEDVSDIDIYELAGTIAYDLGMWHEIATWFGSSYLPLIPERYSSFSAEDIYSNLLGIELGIKALKSDMEFNEAMTKILSEKLIELEAVNSWQETYDIMGKVEDVWWNKKWLLPSKYILNKRYFGEESDHYLLPWIVPGEESDKAEYKISKPSMRASGYYQLIFKLNFRFPVKKILRSSTGKTITQNDLGILVDYIIKDVEKGNQKLARRKARRKL